MPKRRAKRTVKQAPASAEGEVEGNDQKEEQTEENKAGLIDQEVERNRTVKQVPTSAESEFEVEGNDQKEDQIEENKAALIDKEVERESAAIRAVRDVETEHLLTSLRLLRSYFSREQLQTPALQFFNENLPNLSVVRNAENGQFDVRWNNEDGNISILNANNGRDMHASLLHSMSIAYPHCLGISSFGGFEFSTEAVAGRTSLLGAESQQIKDFVFEGTSDSQMLGVHDALRTPGVTSQRLSIGMTPKTLRLPKPGEMLLSVHGSPLGVYKEDNMEAIHETEEG